MLLNDATVLSGPKYDYEFNEFFWRRNGRPTLPEDRVVVSHVRHESPFLIEILVAGAVAGGVGGGFGLIKGLEHVLYTKHRWRKAKNEEATRDADLQLKLIQVERERRELEASSDEPSRLIVIERDAPPIVIPNQAEVLQDPESQRFFARIVRRMKRNSLEIDELSSRPARRNELPPGDR